MRRLERGMTLIEVLVAFVLLSLTLAVIFHIFAGGFRNARLAEEYSRAVFLAESRLAAVGIESGLAPGETTGAQDQGFSWRMIVTPVEEPSATVGVTPSTVRLYQVAVQVNWSEDGRSRQVELTTLRRGPR